MNRLSARGVLTAVLTAACVAVCGSAVAYWGAGGNGTGETSNATAADVTIGPGVPDADLHPGGTADVVVTLTNPGAADVWLSSLVLDVDRGTGGFTVDGAHAGCSVTSLAYSDQNNGGAGWTVTGSSTSPARVLTNALAMDTGAANACQGATFTVHLEAGP